MVDNLLDLNMDLSSFDPELEPKAKYVLDASSTDVSSIPALWSPCKNASSSAAYPFQRHFASVRLSILGDLRKVYFDCITKRLEIFYINSMYQRYLFIEWDTDAVQVHRTCAGSTSTSNPVR